MKVKDVLVNFTRKQIFSPNHKIAMKRGVLGKKRGRGLGRGANERVGESEREMVREGKEGGEEGRRI